MDVLVKLFGPEAAATGRRQVAVRLDGEPTCAALRAALAAAEPRVAPFLGYARFAVNDEFVGPEHRISVGDEVALIGMVSGG